MLFPYTYVPHQMERMQRFVNFIFYQIWCCAPKSGQFNLNLFDANPPLKEVLTETNWSKHLNYSDFDLLRKEIVEKLEWGL